MPGKWNMEQNFNFLWRYNCLWGRVWEGDFEKTHNYGQFIRVITRIIRNQCHLESEVYWSQLFLPKCLHDLDKTGTKYTSTEHSRVIWIKKSAAGYLNLSQLISISFSTAKDCGMLSVPMNGSLTGVETTFPNAVTFSCDEGFILNGSSVRRCLSDGSWSGFQTTCEGELALMHCYLLNAEIITVWHFTLTLREIN